MSFRIWMKNKQLKGQDRKAGRFDPTGPEILALQMLEVSHRLGRRQLEVLAPGGYMKRMTLAGVTGVGLFLLLTVGAPRASADTLTFSLTSDHCTGGCLPSGTTSAGTITLQSVTGGVQVTVALGTGFEFQKSTGFDSVVFNLIGSPIISVSGVTAGWTLFSTSPGSL